MRRVYELSSPPSAPALSATRGWLAALCFVHLPFRALQRQRSTGRFDNVKEDHDPLNFTTSNRKQSLWLLLLTALDLAIWNFLAQGLINIGLQDCSSARASFLMQSSVISTPLLSLGMGQQVSLPLWCGVALAFLGLVILTAGGGTAAASAGSACTKVGSTALFDALVQCLRSIQRGDAIVLAGATCWSMYLLQLSRASSPANNTHGIDFPTLPLQAAKTLMVAFMYSVWWMVKSCFGTTTNIQSVSPWWTDGVAWVWLAISAIGPGALADVLQQQGQKHVSAAEANVILSSEPVFTAICGFLLLGETVARREMVGGTLVLAAALTTSLT